MVTGKSLGDKGERLGPVAVFYDLGEFLPLPGHRHCLQTVDKPRELGQVASPSTKHSAARQINLITLLSPSLES